ncbi:MAG TPA: hypothetical protein EYP59_17245, partial [Thiotrichaceae bacterium]|nr:hypothetical protein [Thiotrichaceae bacterium]
VLELHDGTVVVVKEVDTSVRRDLVYNLSVANTHNYFVGEDGVLVHNARRPKKANLLPEGKDGINLGPKGQRNAPARLDKCDPQQTRYYDTDGKPLKDVDYEHDHEGVGDPHVHDWDYPSLQAPNPVRSPAKPFKPKPWDWFR